VAEGQLQVPVAGFVAALVALRAAGVGCSGYEPTVGAEVARVLEALDAVDFEIDRKGMIDLNDL
jgi:hypothetical protein